jgi:hypothetical protein
MGSRSTWRAPWIRTASSSAPPFSPISRSSIPGWQMRPERGRSDTSGWASSARPSTACSPPLAPGARVWRARCGPSQSLKQKAGVDPLEDLLPALAGQAALVAEPTEASPYASLIVDDVDEKKATAALARLQRPVLTALGTGGPRVPAFQSDEVDGVTVNSVQVSPTVDLSYAVFDGKLVISTQPAGIEQARDGGDDLAGTEAFEKATDGLPDSVSALVFLNLEELLGLPPLKESFAVNPLYASLSQDISRIGSLGIAVRGSEEQLRSDVFLAIDD